MSARTARQSATLDSFRVVKAREAAILRAQARRRRAMQMAFVLCCLVIVAAAGIVGAAALSAGEQLVAQQGRAR
jgi:hypothetical protein